MMICFPSCLKLGEASGGTAIAAGIDTTQVAEAPKVRNILYLPTRRSTIVV